MLKFLKKMLDVLKKVACGIVAACIVIFICLVVDDLFKSFGLMRGKYLFFILPFALFRPCYRAVRLAGIFLAWRIRILFCRLRGKTNRS